MTKINYQVSSKYMTGKPKIDKMYQNKQYTTEKSRNLSLIFKYRFQRPKSHP